VPARHLFSFSRRRDLSFARLIDQAITPCFRLLRGNPRQRRLFAIARDRVKSRRVALEEKARTSFTRRPRVPRRRLVAPAEPPDRRASLGVIFIIISANASLDGRGASESRSRALSCKLYRTMGGHLYLERSYEVSLTNRTLNLLSPGASPICSLHDFLPAYSPPSRK